MESGQSDQVSNEHKLVGGVDIKDSEILPTVEKTLQNETSSNNVTMDMIEKLLAPEMGETSLEQNKSDNEKVNQVSAHKQAQNELLEKTALDVQSASDSQQFEEKNNENTILPATEENTEKTSDQLKTKRTEEEQDTMKHNEEVSTGKPKAEDDLLQVNIKTEPIEKEFSLDGNSEHKNTPESFASVRVKAEIESRQNLVGNKNFIIKSSLGLIAQYNSDSDEDETEIENSKAVEDDEVMEIPIETSKDYRNKVVEIDSDSDDSSPSSDSDIEYIAKIRKEIEKTMVLEEDDEAEDDDDDESTGKNKKRKSQNSMRVKGELTLDNLPPIQDLHITVPEEECIILGRIHSIVDQLLLVSALPGSTLYDLDTVLFLEKGKKVLGTVFDVLGQVADPLYCVRFNSHKEIEEKGLKIGDAVYVAPKTEHTQLVILSNLMKIRGSDASWENDVEPPPRYLDYSDDEQEREARQRIRNKDRSVNRERDESQDDASKRARDDEDDETASVSSAISANSHQNHNVQRNNRRGQNRSQHNLNRFPNNAQRSPQYTSPRQYSSHNSNAGSWHSNYNRPYNYNQSPTAMPQMPLPIQMPNSMPSPYQLFPTYPQFSPMNPPHPMLVPPPMYVPNPYAIRPPQLSQQQISPISTKMPTRSPSPPPPGLD